MDKKTYRYCLLKKKVVEILEKCGECKEKDKCRNPSGNKVPPFKIVVN